MYSLGGFMISNKRLIYTIEQTKRKLKILDIKIDVYLEVNGTHNFKMIKESSRLKLALIVLKDTYIENVEASLKAS